MGDMIGRKLNGRYRIEALVGRGGMADVYRAYDTRRNYPVAVKVLREDLAEDWEFVRRFRAEADVLARLSHQNIVRFYSFEQDGRIAFMVMDFIEGDTLRSRLFDAGRPLSPVEALDILRPVAAALAFAHGEGILHRDVKPGNIMFAANGRVLLADFGIAKIADTATVTTVAPGTPAYMSPEQCRGERLDQRTDIYSLGIVLYEMLTGRRPFVGERVPDTVTGATSERVRWEQIHADPPDPRIYNAALTEGVVRVVLRALEKDPDKRFPSTLTLAEAFEITCGRPTSAGRETGQEDRREGKSTVLIPQQPVDVASATRYRRPWWPAFLIGGMVMLVVIASLAAFFVSRDQPVRVVEATSTHADSHDALTTMPKTIQVTEKAIRSDGDIALTPTPASTATVSPSPTAKPSQTPSNTPLPTGTFTPTPTPPPRPRLSITQRINMRAGPGTAYPILTTIDPGTYPIITRNESGDWWEIQAGNTRGWVFDGLVTAMDAEAVPANRNVPPPPMPTLAPQPAAPVGVISNQPGEGAHIAFNSNRDGHDEIYVMNVDGSGLTSLTQSPADGSMPAWSPDGQRIAFASTRDESCEIYVMKADGSGQTRLTQNTFADWEPAWSPDGQRIAFESERDSYGGDINFEIYLMNADGSGQTRLTEHWGQDVSPAWSPDGKRIAFESNRDLNSEIYVMNTDGSGQINITQNPQNDGEPAWSPDGQRIAFKSERDGNGEIYVMNADGSGQTRLTRNPNNDGWPAWSPDGKRIAFTSERDGNYDIYIMNADGNGLTRLTQDPAWDERPTWSPR